jgi:hypothetical protein
MASYKIIQDIEADDKLLGPLTLRQFIYAGIAALFIYLSYIALIKHGGFVLVIFVPIIVIAIFFAFPWKLNQPTEVWALAKIRFLFLPKNRKWDQNGVKSIVVVTAPEKIVTDYTKGLTSTEIDSRLKSLARTIDTRGWAIKNVNNLSDLTQPTNPQTSGSDRLVGITVTPTETLSPDVKAADDILDVQSNSIARHFENMLHKYTAGQRKNLITSLQTNKQSNPTEVKPADSSNDWFLTGPGLKPANTKSSAPLPKIHGFHDSKPIVAANKTPVSVPKTPMTETSYADILNLANNNDLNVATIARQVNTKQASSSQDEVVISLH